MSKQENYWGAHFCKSVYDLPIENAEQLFVCNSERSKATCKHAPLKWNQTGWLQLMEFSSCRCRFEAEARLHNMWY
uniref:Uncharacterized protein n=1 Tax=Oryza rufipogon TaxID=4529 RepID=A0A679BDY1_ORYRU|nr:hypothetical protein [Oryza rufipogon]